MCTQHCPRPCPLVLRNRERTQATLKRCWEGLGHRLPATELGDVCCHRRDHCHASYLGRSSIGEKVCAGYSPAGELMSPQFSWPGRDTQNVTGHSSLTSSVTEPGCTRLLPPRWTGDRNTGVSSGCRKEPRGRSLAYSLPLSSELLAMTQVAGATGPPAASQARCPVLDTRRVRHSGSRVSTSDP